MTVLRLRETLNEQRRSATIHLHVRVELLGPELAKAVQRETGSIVNKQHDWRKCFGRFENTLDGVRQSEVCNDLDGSVGHIVGVMMHMGDDGPAVGEQRASDLASDALSR